MVLQRWSRSGDLKEAILEIAHSEVSLDVLDVSRQHYFKVENLMVMANSNLKALNCKGVKPLNDNDLMVIANSFPNLEQLRFSNYYREDSRLTDYGVEFLASKLKLLKEIRMSGYLHVSDQSLVALSSNCAFLKAVKVHSRNDGLTENGIGFLLRNSPNLEALSVGSYTKIDSSQSAITLENSISHAKALNSLTFFNMDISDMLLNAIAKAKLPLKNFGLSHAKGLLMVLSNHLTKLRIPGGGIVDLDAENLPNRHLDVKPLLNGDVPNLTHIEFSHCSVTNSIMFLLSTKCPSLVEIRMKCAKFYRQEFNGHNSIPLAKNHKVRNIYFPDSKISDELIKYLALLFPNLRVFDLTGCKGYTSTGIEAILKGCKFIRKLVLKGYREAKLVGNDSDFPEAINLEDLNLARSLNIDDEGLSAIAKKCPRLVSLNLKSCNEVTIEGIKHVLTNIKTLKILHIYSSDNDKRTWQNHDDLLEWMLSTGNFASLKKIHLGSYDFTKEHEEKFLRRGCLLQGM